jgi:surface antigen
LAFILQTVKRLLSSWKNQPLHMYSNSCTWYVWKILKNI